MEKNTLVGAIFITFVTILLALAFLTNLSQTYRTHAVPTSVAGENISVATTNIGTYNVALAYNDIVPSGVVVQNATHETIVENAGYSIDYANGKINITASGNNSLNRLDYYVNYSYYQSTYVKNATARTFENLGLLFFALTIVIVGIIFLKKTGIFDGWK